MNFGIIGNNDGPLYLLKGIQNTSYKPVFIGLQKKSSDQLRKNYQRNLDNSDLIEVFGESELLKELRSYDIDLLINCFCNFKFNELLKQSYEVLNVHLSPLPAYRGRHPLHWALIKGEKEFGITIHKMTEKYDAGPIYWKKNVSVSRGMSVGELRHRLLTELQHHIGGFLRDYEKGVIQPVSNSEKEASYMPRRYPKDSKLTEWQDSDDIFRKVMALRSEDYPAFISIEGISIECVEAKIVNKYNEPPVEPFVTEKKDLWFCVVCLDGRSIWLKTVPGKENSIKLDQIIS